MNARARIRLHASKHAKIPDIFFLFIVHFVSFHHSSLHRSVWVFFPWNALYLHTMPSLTPSSWLPNTDDSDFSLANIPFGVFSARPNKPRPRCCTAIGEYVIDLSVLADAGLLDDIDGLVPHVLDNATLNEFATHKRSVWVHVRDRIIQLLASNDDVIRTIIPQTQLSLSCDNRLEKNTALRNAALHNRKAVTMHLPMAIGDYTDFYSSREHATNVGTMFRGKDKALQPNWLHLPVAYHGRSSTVVCSGTPLHRPSGQIQQLDGSIVHGPTRLLDFELEMAFYVGGPDNKHGRPISVGEAHDRIFGFSLMNDWSARDIQKWEYVPLGPLTAKNFCTTVSPWIVTTMALEDFRAPTSAVRQTNPEPLPYLQDARYSSYDIQLEVMLQPTSLADNVESTTICKSNFRNLYWTAAQQLAHHSVTGCVMKAGDLLASGTISGQDNGSFGSMLELSWKGTKPIRLNNTNNESEEVTRTFLEDGDIVSMKGTCFRNGKRSIGFGDCTGMILPPIESITADEPTDPATTTTTTSNEKKERYENIKLFHSWQSSAAWRVRIVLDAKGIAHEKIEVTITKGEHKSREHTDRVPMAQVPVLECHDTATKQTVRISQTIAIVDFLEQAFPDKKRLVPIDPVARAAAFEMAEIVNSGIHPLQNQPALSEGGFMSSEDLRTFSIVRLEKGLRALESLVSRHHTDGLCDDFALGGFSFTIVEAFMVPQLYNARHRYGMEVDTICPKLAAIEARCLDLPAFQSSHPLAQPGATQP